MSTDNIFLLYKEVEKQVKKPESFEELSTIFLKEFNEDKNKEFFYMFIDEENDEIQINNDDDIKSNFNENRKNSKITIKIEEKNEGKKSKKENKENLKSSNNQIKEEKEIINEKKVPYNFTELHNLGSRMNQLKHREPDDSIEMSMPRENINNIDDINKENLFNDNSICDEMVSMNFDIPNNNWKNNDYINKIGIKNNLVVYK